MNKRFSNIILACAASLIMSASNAGAQVALTPAQQNAINSGTNSAAADLSQRVREFFNTMAKKEAETSFNEQVEEKAAPAAPVKETPEIKIFLKSLQFTESELIDKETLNAISEKYQNQEIVIGDLYKACSEVNEIYAKKGYLASKALIKAQKIDDGVVVITLVEGKVEEAAVKGNKATKARYIERYFDIKQGTYPNFKNIKKQIQVFNNTNSTKLQIKMVPGKAPRTTDIYIVAAEPEKVERFTFFTDNSGRENSGEWRYGLNYSNVNMCGYCDSINIAAIQADTSVTSMLNYSIPTDDKGNRLAVNYSSNHMRVSHGPMKDLDIRGVSEVAGLTYTHPITRRSDKKQKLNIGFQNQHSATDVKTLGARYVHDDNRRVTISYDDLLIRKTDLFYFRPAFSYTDYSSTPLVGDCVNRNYSKLNVDALYQKFKKNGDSLTAQVTIQKAFKDDVSSADRLYVGGVYSVRGYEESLLAGDSGVNVKLDYFWHTHTKGLRAITFFDYANVSGEMVRDTNNISSLGYGLEYRHKDVSMTTTVGYPLKKRVNGVKVDDNNVNVSLNYTF